MEKKTLIHIIKTLVFCNGLGSLITSVGLIALAGAGLSSSQMILASLLLYLAMAMYSGNMASKGLPSSVAARYMPVAVPAAVTALVWFSLYGFSGSVEAMVQNGSMKFYSLSQITHFTLMQTAENSGDYSFVFLLPFGFNMLFIAAFTFFERFAKRKKPAHREASSMEK